MPGAPRSVWVLVTTLAAIVVGFVVAYFGGALGLVLADLYMALVGYPVALAAAGLAAALASKWTSDLLAPDRSRAKLLPVAGWGVGIGVAAGLVLTVLVTVADAFGGPIGAVLVPVSIAATALTGLAALRLREPQRSERRDALVSVGLALAVPGVLALSFALGCAVDMCGA